MKIQSRKSNKAEEIKKYFTDFCSFPPCFRLSLQHLLFHRLDTEAGPVSFLLQVRVHMPWDSDPKLPYHFRCHILWIFFGRVPHDLGLCELPWFLPGVQTSSMHKAIQFAEEHTQRIHQTTTECHVSCFHVLYHCYTYEHRLYALCMQVKQQKQLLPLSAKANTCTAQKRACFRFRCSHCRPHCVRFVCKSNSKHNFHRCHQKTNTCTPQKRVFDSLLFRSELFRTKRVSGT